MHTSPICLGGGFILTLSALSDFSQILPPEMGGTGKLRRIDEAWELIHKGNLEAFLVPGQKL
jgi:hypothetical protein